MMQQLSFDGRTRLQVMVDAAIERLRMFCPPEGYYLAFSGGKDSQCIYHLAQEAGVKFDAHYNITGIDPPELVYHIQRNYPDVQRHPYKRSIWQMIREKGRPPTRMVRYCCEELKERGGEGRIVVTGVRAAEGSKRKHRWGIVTQYSNKTHPPILSFDPEYSKELIHSCPSKAKITVAPIFDWSDGDVWAYIHDRKIQYCSLYDEGFKRLGCIGCPLTSKRQREREFRRWPKMQEAYIRTFDRMLALHPKEGAVDRKGNPFRTIWRTGQDVFDWWIGDVAGISDDEGLFEEVSPWHGLPPTGTGL